MGEDLWWTLTTKRDGLMIRGQTTKSSLPGFLTAIYQAEQA
jgi:hypothetical protein